MEKVENNKRSASPEDSDQMVSTALLDQTLFYEHSPSSIPGSGRDLLVFFFLILCRQKLATYFTGIFCFPYQEFKVADINANRLLSYYAEQLSLVTSTNGMTLIPSYGISRYIMVHRF